MPALPLFIDVQNRCLVKAYNNTQQQSLPNFFQGDTLQLALRFLNATGNPANPYLDADYSTAAVKVGIGAVAAEPTSGTFFLSDPDSLSSTGPIPYNATPAQVQAAVQTLANWSTATVTGANGGPWVITNGVNAARSPLQGGPGLLAPVSQVVVFSTQLGNASNPAVQEIELFQAPIAYQNTWTPSPSASITFAEITAGVVAAAGPPAVLAVNELQAVVLASNTYAGTFTLSFGGQGTTSIAYNATPSTVQAALQALSTIGANNCLVTGNPGYYYVTFTGTLAGAPQALLTGSASNLIVPLVLYGNLALNVAAVQQALGEGAALDEILEINATPAGGSPATLLQAEITIQNNLIKGAPIVTVPADPVLTLAYADARYLRGDSNLIGSVPLTAGLLSFTVATLGLPFIPSAVHAWVTQDGGTTAEVITANPDDTTYSTAGFKVNFSGPTLATHVLHWLCLPPVGVLSNNVASPTATYNVTGTTQTVDLSNPRLTVLNLTAATGTVALTLPNAIPSQPYTLEVNQGATARSLTFPTGTKQKGGGGVTYIPAGPNTSDLIHLLYDGTNFFISVESNYA